MVDVVRMEFTRSVAVLLVIGKGVLGMSACSFVEDGWWRARTALEPIIRAEVRKEYAERLAAAKWMAKAMVRAEMEREVIRRLDVKSPRDALY